MWIYRKEKEISEEKAEEAIEIADLEKQSADELSEKLELEKNGRIKDNER